jgi:hypothetical protein
MQLFINSINKLDVLSWKGCYKNDVCDGIEWELKIKYNNSKTKSFFGSNNYPGGTDNHLNYSQVFHQFLVVIQECIGESQFFDLD